ncbi:hypothetical protein FQA39_LY02516 [Lamprigera yunnana]|nr:hypothetical protein FQA39_LY02516 [Lamprigera yunnana]
MIDIVIDGVDTSPMTREELEVFALAMKERNDKEKEERSFFQLERDKIRTFWEITRNELEEARAKLRNKDRQIEEEAEKNDEKLKSYRQKTKFMQYELQNDFTQCKISALTSAKNEIDNHIQQEWELLRDKRALKSKEREQETAHEEQMKALKTEHSEHLYEASQEFENRIKEVQSKFDKKFALLRQELDTKHKMEMAEVEERKNTEIDDLTKYHETAFAEMKNYYNDITLNNLALIKSLKDQMELQQKQNERMSKQVADVTAENRRLTEPLKLALEDAAEYKKQLQNYERDKITLANTIVKLSGTQKKLDNLTWTNEALELRFNRLQAETDELRKRFRLATIEVQQKCALKNELLQRRIELLNDKSEVKDALLEKLNKDSKIITKDTYKSVEFNIKKHSGGIIDGVDTTQMTREQLEIFCIRIREENEREREERNFFQIERDKLKNFWEITKNELEELKAKLRNKDRQVEETEEKNEEDVKYYKQQVKYLKYEHQNNLTECKAEATVALKLAQDQHTAHERQLRDDIIQLKQQLREQEISYQDLIKALKIKHSNESSETMKTFEMKAKETDTKYSKKYSKLLDELEVKHKLELSEIEERKNTQISRLISNHEKSFTEMKNYYNDITLNNLALISSLKDQLQVFKKQSDDAMKTAATITANNRKLSLPLQKAESEIKELRKHLENYKRDKLAYTNTLAKFHDLKKEFNDLKWSNEVLQLRYDKLQVEHDELYKRFVEAILQIQQKTTLKNVNLQKRIQFLNDVADYRESVIEDLTSSTEIPPQYKKVEEMLSNKNLIIKDLRDELSKMCQAYNELLEMYRKKFDDYGEPIQQIILKEITNGDSEETNE